jgi:hypothetical protein
MSVNNDFGKFNFVTSLSDTFYINSVEENLRNFIDYGFLNIGGFVNIVAPASGLYNNSLNKLKPIKDPAYKENIVWGTHKSPWVWETGISYNTQTPIQISGLTVNNVFYPGPSGSGAVTYTLDYNNSQVVFDKAVSPTTSVSMNYAYKWCKVLNSSDHEGRRILQTLNYKNINTSVENNHSLPLPCIIIESIARTNAEPYELGSLVCYRNQDILAHIYTESDAQRKNIVDILKLQEEKYLKIYDINKVAVGNYDGLNRNGSRNPSGLNYGQLISRDDLLWNTMSIKDVSFIDAQQNVSSTLFWCIVRLTTEIIF